MGGPGKGKSVADPASEQHEGRGTAKGGYPQAWQGGKAGHHHEDEDADASDISSDDSQREADEADVAAMQEADAVSDEDMDCDFKSPFDAKVFATAAECWGHAEKAYGFSLAKIKRDAQGSWTDYHRIKLINYLRKLGPEEARRVAPTLSASALLSALEDDSLLIPVMPDDSLLFEEDSDAEEDVSQPAFQGYAETSAPVDCRINGPSEPLEVEVQRLRRELRSAQSLLADVTSGGSSSSAAAGPAFEGRGMSSSSSARPSVPLSSSLPAHHPPLPKGHPFDPKHSRTLITDPALAKAFLTVLTSDPSSSLKGRMVLNSACGAGVLSCLCAKLGASTVVAVDISLKALELAHSLLQRNPDTTEAVKLLRGNAAEGSIGGSPSVDVLFSERWISELYYSPAMIDLLEARQRNLKPGGMVVPSHARLLLEAVDYSEEQAVDAALWKGPLSMLAGLDVSPLAPDPPSMEITKVSKSRVTSPAFCLADLSLATASPSQALLNSVPFELELKSGSQMSGLALRVEAPICAQTDSEERLSVVLRLSTCCTEGFEPLRISSAEHPHVRGQISTSWAAGGCLRVSIHLDSPSSVVGDFLIPPSADDGEEGDGDGDHR
mmetsp:Transcript_35310/g.75237  ORF Transcript_35310/g.75237 Transcript_35310/m.75237 type:complete len:609 (+) Transcript_35310:76-1902(+)|eukprot:CAMPEP_0206432128 /NCGR_PEP_ID=MMETSP0324_2-20121206/7743_1 /ASSEMBLY_ACC=CAM_ASM_000836 /TAXON_ID=2866 /ORGANISM="Crypthecodinium cohnii, Strain Seligo" /LENGTH=608 /DNA_ID=CAMNT_0053898123 /DNA_START=53 /DNA_END=1879 /DNA_ORIENTATION=-